MSELTAGQCVKLKSGSPNMTIRWIREGEAYCEWFVGGKVEGKLFVLAQLTVPSEPRPSAPQRGEW
jgi:uncharacterized protein YodC (DUF2158 family)